jgi:tetratricopeptide (TPR) repeat protein
MALANGGEMAKAAEAFEKGEKKAPRDKRFPIELAGLAFRAHDFERSKRLLYQALSIDKQDAYANDFLATLYFLDGNLDAALKYWNHAGKPMLENVTSDPEPRLSPAMLDRAFTFAPGTVLTLEQLHETQQRVELLHVYPNYRFDVVARPDGRFDVLFHNSEKNGWGKSKMQKLVNLFRQLPMQTITPEAYNLRGKGANFVSLYRFAAQNRRLFASYSAPVQQNPKWRYGIDVDLRKENWDLRYPDAISSAARDFTMEKAEAGAQLETVVSPNWHWTSAVQYADRRFLHPFTSQSGDTTFLNDFLQDGPTLKYMTQMDGTLIRMPERRLAVSTTAGLELGKWWARPAQSFTKLHAGMRATWLPQPRGDDYAFTAQFRAGKTFGMVPLDELNVLGIGGDNDLWLRGHAVTHSGKKGSAPIGRDYLLFNSEWDKNVYSGGFFQVKVGPFFDTGRISDPSGLIGSREWLFDTGVQVKVRLFGGMGIALSYGRDLRGGTNALVASSLH